MGILLVSIAGFMMAWAVFEFFAMMFTFGDYGDSALLTFIMTFVFAMMILGVTLIEHESDDEPTEQATQLDDQWANKVVEDIVLGVKEDIAEKIASPEKVMEQMETYQEHTFTKEDIIDLTVSEPTSDQRVVPSNKAHIEASRRNYDVVVSYIKGEQQACDENGCFRVKLIQHTDGSFWACKRNYGVCYEYE